MNDIIGSKIEKLYIEEYVGKDHMKGNLFLCLCDCGMDRVLSRSQLGSYKSCGCKKEIHGKKNSPEHTSWRKMKERCYNTKQDNYSYYGGRGIKVCDRWLDNFSNFYYDMGDKPTPKHQLDRIDSDGDYKPSNCRWVTKSENMINRNIKTGTSGHSNIRKRSSGKFRVVISRNGIRYMSLSYNNIEDAIKIRDIALNEYKEFGYIKTLKSY